MNKWTELTLPIKQFPAVKITNILIHNLCPEIRPHCIDWSEPPDVYEKIRDYLLIFLLFCALCFFDAMHCKHIWNKTPITTEWVINLWDVPLSISSGSCWLFLKIWWWYINALRSPLAVHSFTYVTATQIFLQTCYIKRGLQKLSEGKAPSIYNEQHSLES